MDRRTLIILLAVGIGALLAVVAFIYFLFFAGKGGTVVVGEPGATFGEAPDYEGGAEIPDVGVAAPGAGTDVAPRLVRVTEGPAALGLGVRVIPAVAGSSSTPAIPADVEVRYVERASGHIYAYRVVARTLTRLTNQTLPGIEEVAWTPDASLAFLRFLSDTAGEERIETYALSADDVGGYFLEPDLAQVSVAPDSTVMTLLPSSTGSVATLASASGGNVRTLFSSPLAALRVFAGEAGYVSHTNASAGSQGYGFLITASGAFERVLGPLRGLALLPSPATSALFYSYLSGSSLQTAILDIETREVTPLPLATLAEKCAWVPDGSALFCAVPRALSGTLPDDWYQGATSFSDRIWRVDLASRVATLVLDPSQSAQTTLDAASLTLDAGAQYLFFVNRTDGSVWSFAL